MAAFFRVQHATMNPRLGATVASSSTKQNKEEEEESVRDLIRRRVRRQAANRKKGKGSDDSSGWNPLDLDARLSRRSCQKKNLYVSFRDLGWQVILESHCEKKRITNEEIRL